MVSYFHHSISDINDNTPYYSAIWEGGALGCTYWFSLMTKFYLIHHIVHAGFRSGFHQSQ